MKSSTITIAVLVIILIGGGIWLITKNSDQTSQVNTNAETNINLAVETTNVNTAEVANTNTTIESTEEDDRSFNTTNTDPTSGATNTAVVPPPVTNTNTQAPVQPTVTITISSSGMSPSSPTIASSTTVVFQNTDSVPHQIASNPHPIHTNLSGFDFVISAGNSQSFTFNKVGTWSYHDHLNPATSQYQGTITVQ